MVGLSVVLEGGYKGGSNSSKKSPQVISKYSMMMIRPSSSTTFNGRKCCDLRSFSATDDFLQYCFLCKQKLLPAKDIYMYKGDRAFCSEECRCRQILMDEDQEITTS